MKTALLLFALFAFPALAADLSRIGGFIGHTPRDSTPAIRPGAIHPYRHAAVRYWNIAPLFTAPGGRVTTLPGWEYLWGTVSENGQGGIFLQIHDYFHANGEAVRIFVKNYPFEIPDGRQIYLYALRAGTMQYRTVMGSTATVAQYDYGTPYDPFALATKTNITIQILTNTAPTNTAKPKQRTIYK